MPSVPKCIVPRRSHIVCIPDSTSRYGFIGDVGSFPFRIGHGETTLRLLSLSHESYNRNTCYSRWYGILYVSLFRWRKDFLLLLLSVALFHEAMDEMTYDTTWYYVEQPFQLSGLEP